MTNIEDLLRDTLRAREGDISVAPRFDAARVPSPREAPSRNSWFGPPWRMAGAGAAILAVVATGFALSTLTGPDPSEPAKPTERIELEQTRLWSSVVIEGSNLATLVAAVRGLVFDGTVDTSCRDPRAVPEEDVVMALHLADGSVRYLVLAEQGCDTVVIAATHPDPAAITLDVRQVVGQVLHGGPPLG